MDRVTLQQRLEEVERLIAREERNVTHQNGMIETLERGGHDATIAKMFLRLLESRQARFVADRDRLLRELADRVKS